ncbi:FapA family protein [Texcoconibacillus texcoconensis]|uniref:Flagellar Assembly Protein A N-terminal region domain-containing protein n=1 Tax=Texcoconibacillus texcoconensis TaxID=1095777 RepID=A0A840QCK9_9BACI|nr:hypothetical protein [Texcoconibacillus texcoconensis]
MGSLYEVLEVEISEEKQQAILKQNQRQEAPITLDELKHFLVEHGITYGLKEEVLNSFIEGSISAPVVVAEGKQPIDGEDAYLQPVYPTNGDGKMGDDMYVDLKHVIDIPSVTQGTLVGKKVPKTEGQKGMNIFGEEVEAKPGKDMKLRKGKNTQVNDDGTKLYAVVDGQMSVETKVIHVYPVYEVNGDLDLKTGNIDFVGNVNIRGNVPTGFEVRAGGDIRINGSVEAATLHAGGSIFINQGIVAEGKGEIHSANDLHTLFINQGNVVVEKDVHVTQSIFHSDIQANGMVYCTQRKGNIVGGSVSAGRGIEVNEVGNDMNTPTSLYLGVNKKGLEREQQLQKQIEESNDEKEKLNQLLSRLLEKEKQGSLTGQERVLKLRIRNSLNENEQKQLEGKEKLNEIQDLYKSEALAQVNVYQTIHPNVDIYFGKYRRKVITKHQNVRFRLNDGEITFMNL